MKQSPADQKHRSKEQEAEMARQAGRERPRRGRRGSGVSMRAG